MQNVTLKIDNDFEKIQIKQKLGTQVNQGMPDGIQTFHTSGKAGSIFTESSTSSKKTAATG